MLCISNRLKTIFILIFILFLTGCKATYNININLSSVNEELEVIEKDQNKFSIIEENLYNLNRKDYLDTNLKWPTPAYKDSEINPYEPTKISNENYYTKKDISNSSQIGIKYSYNHLQDKYRNSNILNTCYDFELEKTNNNILFKTIDKFKCFDEYPLLDEVEINVTSMCNVISNNSDKNEENKYTWNITKDNYEDKTIEFELECIVEEEKEDATDYNLIGIIIFLSFIALAILVMLFVKILNLKNNKI